MATTTLDYLIPDLRIKLGDLTVGSYRYLDEWLLNSLIMAVKALGRRWNFKYLLNDSNEAYRNPNVVFLFSEPPVIQDGDEYIIVLQGAIIIKSGSLENNSWNVGSWRDAEIAYSNIEGNKSKEFSYQKDLDELEGYLKSPSKRLAVPKKGSLPGYLGNDWERTGLH